jgi:hypothetical protein
MSGRHSRKIAREGSRWGASPVGVAWDPYAVTGRVAIGMLAERNDAETIAQNTFSGNNATNEWQTPFEARRGTVEAGCAPTVALIGWSRFFGAAFYLIARAKSTLPDLWREGSDIAGVPIVGASHSAGPLRRDRAGLDR